MTAIAFHGDPAIKARARAALGAHVTAGTFVYFPAWNDGKANAIGAIVEADDTPAYAAGLGYPPALADTLPIFINGIRPLDEAAAFALAWLERTPVGADLSTIVSQLILTLLDRPDLSAMASRHAALEDSRQTIMALHRRVIGGDEPDRKQWKTARLAAVGATDAIAEDQALARRAAAVVEAAAWPGSMRTVLRDTLNASGSLTLYLSLAEMEWTTEEEARAYRIREQAEKDGYMAELQGFDRYFAILDTDHPELGARFRMRCDRMAKADQIYGATGWTAIAAMEAAPVIAATGTAQ